ncbi:MAG: hypothetical protein F4Y67_01300 [Chloroflexi bacterium]|nr:hypothetical protein [Chloroflexota bacterium]
MVLGRAALEAGISVVARGGNAPGERAGQSGGTAYLLLAAGIAALIVAAPGLLIALSLAGFSPGPP